MHKANFSARYLGRESTKEKVVSKTAKRLLLVILVLVVFLFFGSLWLQPVLAQSVDVGLSPVGANIGLGTQDIRITIARVIRILLGLLGLVAVVIILYGGWIYMTSQGIPEKINQAKKILIGAIIGLIIILAGFAITSFVISALLGGQYGGGAGISPYGGGGGALGAGIIEDHYPLRNQTNVPRNTIISITFKEGMCVQDLIDDKGTPLNFTDDKIKNASGDATDTIRIYAVQENGEKNYVTNVNAAFVQDPNNKIKTFIFDPVDALGSPDQPVMYRVELTTKIRKVGCTENAFRVNGYFWVFTVSTVLDLTPPQISGGTYDIIPQLVTDPVNNRVDKNTVVRLNFTEPINPLSFSPGLVLLANPTAKVGPLGANSYTNINVYLELFDNNSFVGGQFIFSNQYKTVEFISKDPCGVNSCGQQIYCLPGNKLITVLVKAAALLDPADPTKGAITLLNGLADMANNPLDGNYDGQAKGPVDPPYNLNQPPAEISGYGDNVQWSFYTNDNIDLEAPEIMEYQPLANDAAVDPRGAFNIYFTKLMMSSTITSSREDVDYITLLQDGVPEAFLAGYWLGNENVELPINEVVTPLTIATMRHEILGANRSYGLNISSNLKDNKQNCYLPCSGPGCQRQGADGQYTIGEPWSATVPTYPSCTR